MDGEAKKGKQAVDLNAFQETAAWGENDQGQGQDAEALSVVGGVKCYKCGKNGHTAPNCPNKGKGKGKGK